MQDLAILTLLVVYAAIAWPFAFPAVAEPPPPFGWKPRVYRRVAMLGERRVRA